MTHKELKTLEEIEAEVGTEIFQRWKSKVNIDYKASPYLYRGADAHHAFLFEGFTKLYDNYKETQLASQMASREILDLKQSQLWEGR